MFNRILRIITLLVLVSSVRGETLPGFSLQKIASPEGFPTSIAFDAGGVLHYTTMDGGIYRVDADGQSEVARVDSANEGNAALLGMAFAPDGTVVVHYVSSDLTADLVSRIDLETKNETVLARLQCSPNGARCPTEHHGGNPDVTADGTIFFGIGDYGLLNIAQRDDVHAAKIHRISPEGTIEVWSKGLRNPFDLAWDDTLQRLIVADNGASGNDDEILYALKGENHGWPLTMGPEPPVPGMTPPVFVFPERTAPTGLDLLHSERGWFRRGMVVSSFVTKALYYFPSYDESGVEPPIVIFRGETTPLVDVRQSPDGEIYVASAYGIFRVDGPVPGDVDGDGRITRSDYDALIEEVGDSSAGSKTINAHEGTFCSSWGADVDQNGEINADDLAALARLLSTRRRGVDHRVPLGRDHPASRHGTN